MRDDDAELEALRKRKLQELMQHAEAQADAPQADADADADAEADAGPEMPSEPVTVTDANLQETAQKYPLLVVDCWAPWCGPCHAIEPVVKELAHEMQGSVVFGKLNVDENPGAARQFGVQSIPTFLVFRDGKPVDRMMGALPKAQLSAHVRRHMPRGRTPGPRRI